MERHKGSLVSSCPSEAKPEKGAGKREHPSESPKDDKDDPKKLKLGTNPKPSSLPGASSAPKIAIALGAQKIAAPSTLNMKPTSSKLVAKAFNVSDDDDEEEMPAEARMRMRNIGRETPTSAGPNSFGKTKKGFTDYNGLFQKKLNEIAAESEGKTSTSTAVPAPHDKIKK